MAKSIKTALLAAQETHEMLLPAVRNYPRNDGKGLLTAYSKLGTEYAVGKLAEHKNAIHNENVQLKHALRTIEEWNSLSDTYSADYGSNGVREFYRNIARKALDKTNHE